MSVERQSVIAAIPNYNMGQELAISLPPILEQGYDDVYVLDDSSTNEDTFDVYEDFKHDITVINGTENFGAAGNRNRVIQHAGSALIHFMDADTTLNSSNTPDLVREGLEDPNVGYVGGLILNEKGEQVPFNHGSFLSVRSQLGLGVQFGVDALRQNHPNTATKIRKAASSLVAGWPNTLEEPKAQQVYWATEGNLAIPANTLRKVHGFDAELRFFESQDLSWRLAKMGLIRMFDPRIEVTHRGGQYEGKNPLKDQVTSIRRMAGKVGIKQLLFGNEIV